MKPANLKAELSSTTYPGRGIIIGRSQDNENTYIAYFIMGRSENSRNRIFEYTDDGIQTTAFDPSKLVDPSLIIYHPVRVFGGSVIVTNGDQTDTIRDYMAEGRNFRDALLTREFEPDEPNYTPRISGIVMPNGSYKLSILKSNMGDPSCCCRSFFEYDKPKAGLGHFIHTYMGDGKPLPSYEGEPTPVEITGTMEQFGDDVWQSINEDNKVSLYVCQISTSSGKILNSKIYNKNN